MMSRDNKFLEQFWIRGRVFFIEISVVIFPYSVLEMCKIPWKWSMDLRCNTHENWLNRSNLDIRFFLKILFPIVFWATKLFALTSKLTQNSSLARKIARGRADAPFGWAPGKIAVVLCFNLGKLATWSAFSGAELGSLAHWSRDRFSKPPSRLICSWHFSQIWGARIRDKRLLCWAF